MMPELHRLAGLLALAAAAQAPAVATPTAGESQRGGKPKAQAQTVARTEAGSRQSQPQRDARPDSISGKASRNGALSADASRLARLASGVGAALQSKSKMDAAEKARLIVDLMALADPSNQPRIEHVESLVARLAEARGNGRITPTEQARLAQDLKVVFNSAALPVSEIMAIIKDARGIVLADGTDPSDAQAISNDLLNIAIDLKKNIQAVEAESEPPPNRETTAAGAK
jgi:hypothetical protein